MEVLAKLQVLEELRLLKAECVCHIMKGHLPILKAGLHIVRFPNKILVIEVYFVCKVRA